MNHRVLTQSLDYYHQLLGAVFELMLLSGANAEDIQHKTSSAFRKAQRANASLMQRRREDLPTAALILDRWHRTRRYIDNAAKPKEIPLKGPAPSVEALIRSEGLAKAAHSMIAQMRSLKLIVKSRNGLYKPSGSIALIGSFSPLVHQHAARTSCLLLSTVKQNVTSHRPSTRLVERFTEVPDLPSECVEEFRKFTAAQSWALIKTVNDWLEARRSKRYPRRRKSSIRAGLHVFAYLDVPEKRRPRSPGKNITKRAVPDL